MTDHDGAQGGAARLISDYPEVWKAYAALGEAAAEAGPLTPRERRLVKLALAIGAGSEGAVHSHARRAEQEGLSAEDLHQTCLLAINSLGFPAAMAAMSWVHDLTRTQKG